MSIFCERGSPGREKRVNGARSWPGFAHLILGGVRFGGLFIMHLQKHRQQGDAERGPLPVPAMVWNTRAYARCPGNIAKPDRIHSRRRIAICSGSIPVFSGFIPAGIRGVRETRYNRARYGLGFYRGGYHRIHLQPRFITGVGSL